VSILLGLGLGAKVLGIGGTGLFGLGARLLGYDRKIVAAAKRIPPKGWLILGIVAALIVGFFVHQHKAHAAIAAAKAEQKAVDDAVLAQLVATYRAAAAKARADDAANAQRVHSEQNAINERTDHDFEARIADARARAGRLQPTTATHPGGRGAAPVPGVPSTASIVAEIAGEDRFSLADRLTATEQAIQLDELIKWVKAQATVDPNKPTKPSR
jgi:hypothetical protein